jgi:large subunit ribosomal protein L23
MITMAYDIIKYPLSTEKAIRMMEAENKLIFVVEKRATKADIKSAVEEAFNVKVKGVNTQLDHDGNKKAYVKLSFETPAIDVASNLGIMG